MQLQRIHATTLVVLLLAATSCSGNNDSSQTSDPPLGALSFAANSGSRSLVENDNDLHSGGFAVWGEYVSIVNQENPVRVFTATPVTYTNGNWGYNDTQYWFPGNNYSFVALHPASHTANVQYNGGTEITITDYNVVADENKGTDLLAAAATRQCTGSSAMGIVNFSFKHLLTQLNFVPRVNPSVTQKVIIESAHVYGIPSIGTWTGFNADGTAKWVINTNAGNTTTSANPLGTVSTETIVTPGETDSKALFTNDNPLLCVPQTIPHNAVFSITYHYEDTPSTHKTLIYRLQLASTTLTNGWESGKTYRYTFEIGNNDFILFSNPEVVPWDDKGGSNIIIQGDQTT